MRLFSKCVQWMQFPVELPAATCALPTSRFCQNMSLGQSSVSSEGLAASSAHESCAESLADESCADSLVSSSCDGADEKPPECHDVDDATLGGMSLGSRTGSAGLAGDSDDGGTQTIRQWLPGERATRT